MHRTEPLSFRTGRADLSEATSQLSAVSQAVEVLVLTTDNELLNILRASVSGEQRHVWHAPGFQQAAELIMAGRVGVAIIDASTTGEDTGTLCAQFRSQFPDLILIVAGTVQEQTPLVSQITSGEIYRFLHKPISEARARQFIETSVRRHLDGRTVTAADARPPLRLPGKPVMAIAAAAIAVVVAIVIWASNRGDAPEPVNEAAVADTAATPTLELAPTEVPIDRAPIAAPAATKVAPATSVSRSPAPAAPAVARTNTPAPVVAAPKSAEPPAAEVAVAPEAPAQSPPSAVAATEAKEPPAAEAAIAATETSATVGVVPAVVPEKAPAAVPQSQPASAPALSPREAFLANVAMATALPRTRQVDPVYPNRARRDGTEGWVELDFTVDARGGVKDIEMRDGAPRGVFDKAASDALAQWKFKPVLRDGRAVEQRARVRLRFQIEK